MFHLGTHAFEFVQNSTEQRVSVGLEALEDLAEPLRLSTDVRKDVATMFGEVVKRNLTDGRKTESVVGASVCLTTRELGEPIPITRIARELDVERQSFARLVRRLCEELGLDSAECQPEDYLRYISRDLEFNEEIIDEAREWLHLARKEGLTNERNPTGVAGAALYGASGGAQPQRTVAKVAGVSKETLRVRINEFRERGLLNE